MVCQQAAPGNVSTRELPGRCWIVRNHTYTRSVLARSADVRGSRLPGTRSAWLTQSSKTVCSTQDGLKRLPSSGWTLSARGRAPSRTWYDRLSLGPSTSQIEAPDHELSHQCQAHGTAQIRRGITFPKWQRPRRAEIFALPENKILGDKAERASLFRLQE